MWQYVCAVVCSFRREPPSGLLSAPDTNKVNNQTAENKLHRRTHTMWWWWCARHAMSSPGGLHPAPWHCPACTRCACCSPARPTRAARFLVLVHACTLLPTQTSSLRRASRCSSLRRACTNAPAGPPWPHFHTFSGFLTCSHIQRQVPQEVLQLALRVNPFIEGDRGL